LQIEAGDVPADNVKDEVLSIADLENKLKVDIPEAISAKNAAFNGEVEVVRNVVDQEKQIIGELESELINKVPDAINKKNEAFTQDITTISGIIQKELEVIKGFETELQNLTKSFASTSTEGLFGNLFQQISESKDALKSFAEILSRPQAEIDKTVDTVRQAKVQ